MSDKLKRFRLFVISFVVATGFGFGCWAGMVYGKVPSVFVGGMLGAAGGYFVARLYLYWLMKIVALKDGPVGKWFFASFAGAFCGVICTSFTHVLLVIISGFTLGDDFGSGLEMWPVVMGFANAIGAVAGFVVGGICTLLYLTMRDEEE